MSKLKFFSKKLKGTTLIYPNSNQINKSYFMYFNINMISSLPPLTFELLFSMYILDDVAIAYMIVDMLKPIENMVFRSPLARRTLFEMERMI